MPKEVGDNTKYPDEVREKLLDLIADGQSLNQIEKMEGMPTRHIVHKWNRNDDVWVNKYRQACEDRAENMVERSRVSNDVLLKRAMNGQANSVLVAAIKQHSEFSKWQCEIHKPKKYSKVALDEIAREQNQGTKIDSITINIPADYDKKMAALKKENEDDAK